MNILIVSQYFYPEDFKVNDIAFDFVKRGHKVTVFTAKPNYPQGKFYKGYSFFSKSREYIKGVEVIRVPIFPRLDSTGKFLVINYLSFVFFAYLFKYRVKGEFDVVFAQQASPILSVLPAIWFKNKFKIKLYTWTLDLWPESVLANSNIKEGFLLRQLNKLVKYIYDCTDVILISSNFFKDSILNKGININKKIVYFPNWAEDVFTHKLDCDQNTFNLPVLPKGFNIMFAGNIGESQDFESILKAVKLTEGDEINWILVGDGRKTSWIRSEIESKKLKNIFLLGRYPLESMPYLFKQADAMLVSLKDSPAFSLTVPAKVQAYMASSKIILGMFNGEGQILINNSKCGFAVNAGDFIGLANVIREVQSFTIAEIAEMENNSKQFYDKHFSKERLFQDLEHLFEH